MTDNEIIKALEVHTTSGAFCDECPIKAKKYAMVGSPCIILLLGEAKDLINRQRAEIKRLEIELKAMRGAANSFKADVKRLQEAEAKRIQETVSPLVIRNNKIPAQELAKMINLGVISTDIEDAEIETMAFDIDDIIASMKNEPNYMQEVAENIIAKAEGLNVTTDQLECFLNKMVVGEDDGQTQQD